MEEPYNKQDKILKKLFTEAPLDKPSLDFSKNVMNAIEKQKIRKLHHPLISKTAWITIATLFIIGLIWLYFNPSSSVYDVETLSLSEKLNLKNPFEGISFSKTTIYAIGFMALFLLQIPLLKRIVEKRYE